MARGNSIFDKLRRKLKVVGPSQGGKKLDVSFYEMLECPVCFNTMYPPIYQCFNGHPLCSNCKSKMDDRCPICRRELDNIRCLTLEKVTGSLELPCKYHKYGCSDFYPYHDKLKHESKCSFGLYNCLGYKCSVRGNISFLMRHLKDNHKGSMRYGSTIVQGFKNYNPPNDKNIIWYPMVISCFGQYFHMHFEKFRLGGAWVYIAFLRLMGDEKVAKTYRYSLEFVDNERKTTWKGVPRSIRESHRKVRDSLDGLIIQKNLFFGGDKKKLELEPRVTVKIWKGE